ncbi:MAG: hypothetical protein QOF82_2280, partial [Frankiales bacterium]|nr:hypothetical protein [Frankiales bacterium]
MTRSTWAGRLVLVAGCLASAAGCTGSGSSGSAAISTPTAAARASSTAPTGGAVPSPSRPAHASSAPAPAPTATKPAAALSVALAPWRLPSPLSRMAALAAPGGGIELLGGLLNGDHSSAQVQHVALPGGAVTADGRLAVGVHDTAGAVVGTSMVVYAGGAASEVAVVQRAVRGGTAATAGALPQPRSDLVVATVGDQVV